MTIEARHDTPVAGHPGIYRMLELLTRKFYWPTMRKSIKLYIKSCESCLRSKHSNLVPVGLLQPIPIPQCPWEEIAYDLIVALPESDSFNAIFTVVDRFSKMVHFIPTISKATASDVANLFVTHVWKLHGLPRKTISD